MIWFILAIVVVTMIARVTNTLNLVIGVLVTFAVLVFSWGIVNLILRSDNETEQKKAKNTILWGVVGLAAMILAWGVVTVIVDYFLGPGGGPFRGIIPAQPGGIP
ncbi:MAG: hypothetical protein A3C07_01240 [Candidatus Sungbacteria bacterium RIFCSPHIGHO2_02_FULL_47_11]|uniref:Uncharacterized protein n=1 Tax=Candidatus Sungbacteria bacterium RIFCSPHIGHO2_02_FULL_47_11 TaxID=1802270 RepID=A0A1G2KLY7_9BACT|nr:MAG: hypothetical protein A3C07_01240 [Candidatus Sungbacteria bacterium RIFCSPHIGHO2_02_FULL_47_11]